MRTFQASLRAEGDVHGLDATVVVDNGRLSIAAGEIPIGEWSLKEIRLEQMPTGYRMSAEGDLILLEMSDIDGFAEALKNKKSRFGRKKKEKPAKSAADAEPSPVPAESDPGLTEPAPPEPEAFVLPFKSEPEEPAPIPEQPEPEPTPIAEPTPTAEPAPIPSQSDPQPFQPPPSPFDPVRLEPVPAADEPREASEMGGPRPVPSEPQEAAPVEKPKNKSTIASIWSAVLRFVDLTLDVAEARFGPYVPKWVFNRLTFLVGVIWLLAGIIWPGPVSVIVIIVGGLIIMFGAVAYSDSVIASRLLPGRTTPNHVLVVGIVVLLLGLLLAFVSR